MSNSDICEFFVVRHGQTVANKTGILQGQLDTDLDEDGLMQAEAVAQRLKNRTFDVVYSSDLNRAMVTAQKILQFHQELKIIPSPELREWNLGDLQGRKYDELIVKYPEIMQAFKCESADIPDIPCGERLADFQVRVASFMDKIAAENIGRKILMVSHGGALQRMLVHTMGQVSQVNIRPLCDNASLSIFKYKNGKWQLITWNDTAHLENIGTHSTLTF